MKDPKWGKRHWKDETDMHHMSIDSIVLWEETHTYMTSINSHVRILCLQSIDLTRPKKVQYPNKCSSVSKHLWTFQMSNNFLHESTCSLETASKESSRVLFCQESKVKDQAPWSFLHVTGCATNIIRSSSLTVIAYPPPLRRDKHWQVMDADQQSTRQLRLLAFEKHQVSPNGCYIQYMGKQPLTIIFLKKGQLLMFMSWVKNHW